MAPLYRVHVLLHSRHGSSTCRESLGSGRRCGPETLFHTRPAVDIGIQCLPSTAANDALPPSALFCTGGDLCGNSCTHGLRNCRNVHYTPGYGLLHPPAGTLHRVPAGFGGAASREAVAALPTQRRCTLVAWAPTPHAKRLVSRSETRAFGYQSFGSLIRPARRPRPLGRGCGADRHPLW